MIIKELFLNNFRQFTDEQKIEFSTDENKKVTFIMAESGVGKTTLIQSFQWALYGKCKYSKILNEDIKNSLQAGQTATVTVSLVINHGGRDYTITRKQLYRKINVRIDSDNSILTIDYKGEDGISKQVRGREADSLVKTLMHQDLFPYFFLEGESLTKVGEQMSRGKNGSNKDFINAIKGLLGFNHLYETVKHLSTVSSEYNSDIARNTSSEKLRTAIENINKCDEDIKLAGERIITIDTEISYNKTKRDELSEKLMAFGEIETKQKRTKTLSAELSLLKSRIDDRKRVLFKKFSNNGFYAVLDSMLAEARETLKNSDSIDKGVPGMNVDAVKWMLENHKCICGEELIEGSEHWEKLNEWMTFLPPNNIGFELETFSNEMKQIERQAKFFDEDFIRERKALSDDIKEYDSKVEELDSLNKDIGGVREDIGLLKQQEQSYNNKIVDLKLERKNKENYISELNAKRKEISGLIEIFQKQDEKTQKLQNYYAESEFLKNRISRFILRKEKEKREKLTAAINEVFKDFYEENITFSLDTNYGVQIKTYDKELSDDFTSGGQDVAVALAFIGAIIKLSGEKDIDPELVDEDENSESYPLVLDAPTSNFGMKQMKSFSEIMPKITDQIIVFINDKDGPILYDLMKDRISSEWVISQEKGDSFHSRISKGGM